MPLANELRERASRKRLHIKWGLQSNSNQRSYSKTLGVATPVCCWTSPTPPALLVYEKIDIAPLQSKSKTKPEMGSSAARQLELSGYLSGF